MVKDSRIIDRYTFLNVGDPSLVESTIEKYKIDKTNREDILRKKEGFIAAREAAGKSENY